MELALQFDSKSTYQFKRKIGSGGSAEVFLYSRQTPGLPAQDVALKILKAQSEDQIRELLNEGRRLGSLRHPNILTTFGYEKIDETNFGLVLEYFPGENLKALAPRIPAEFRASVTAYIIKTVCEATALAHSQNIVHGDLSGRNILISEQGLLKLSDFGLARRMTATPQRSHSHGTKIKGSADYMAPELWNGLAPSAGADVFAIGILALELLYGANPLAFGDSPASLDEGLRRVTSLLEKSFLDEVTQVTFPAWRSFFEGALRINSDQRVTAQELMARVPRAVEPSSQARGIISEMIKSSPSAPGHLHSRTQTHFFPQKKTRTSPVSCLRSICLFAVVVLLSASARPDDGFSGRRRPCFLTLTSRPWGELFVDGISRGYTPFINLPIPAGFHRLTWRDPDGRAYQKTLMAFENGTLAYKISREKDGRLVGAPLPVTGRSFGSPR